MSITGEDEKSSSFAAGQSETMENPENYFYVTAPFDAVDKLS